jgi:hypothetical protein
LPDVEKKTHTDGRQREETEPGLRFLSGLDQNSTANGLSDSITFAMRSMSSMLASFGQFRKQDSYIASMDAGMQID